MAMSILLCSLLLVACSVSASPTSDDRQAHVQQQYARQGQPCAQLSSSILNGVVPAQLALACLRTVPLQQEANLGQLDGLRVFLQYQSDLYYLNSSQPTRLYPDVDLLAGLNSLEQRLGEDYYSNEYDFQADIARLFASAYDGHLVYVPDIVSSFSFARFNNGRSYPLMSVSSNGIALPEVFAREDLPALGQARGQAYEPSPIIEINGQNAEDFLNNHAALTGALHDPDANYNNLFRNELTRQFRPFLAGSFEEFSLLQGPAEETVLTFQNGSEQRLQLLAAPRPQLDVAGLRDGSEFFSRCCNGSVTPMLSDPSMLPSPGNTKRSVDLSLLGEDPTLRHLRSEEVSARVRWDAHLPSMLQTRQASGQSSTFPEPAIRLEDGSLAGYFPESVPNLAVLALSSFLPNGSPDVATLEFQSAVREFLDNAVRLQKSRLVIDLRGNGGGYGFLAHDLFRQLFPREDPFDGSNYRANSLLDFTGQSISDLYAAATPSDFAGPEDAPIFFSGAFPFNYRQLLNANNETFSSWSDFFGPVMNSQVEDNFTAVARPDLNDPFQTGFPIFPLGQPSIPEPAFSPENIVMLHDGGCASACVLFSEFMKTDAPSSVRSIVVGGRRQEGPMQYAGGVKGGQLGNMAQLGFSTLFAVESGTLAQQLQFATQFGDPLITSALAALDRATLIPGGGPTALQAGVNLRNTIREGDESDTPLQYMCMMPRVADSSILLQCMVPRRFCGREPIQQHGVMGPASLDRLDIPHRWPLQITRALSCLRMRQAALASGSVEMRTTQVRASLGSHRPMNKSSRLIAMLLRG
ncbi:Putative Tail specific protease, ClpP/crotonase-like domain superfamily [Septoria linicola]|uniref:Tail specific protease, ClpP/crotonase-like domain superfamily n=1 Tax=Septoria linicola TaxID=215465 RepID=A0A9Q9EFU2_9PEZI|nr:putative Tail specific protease, ClpP/crotonase-like domain superfamily [Septoria linicola]USW49320.1 Putative Tail specific protease, ClpP/crotonase-like domain superfamily [Septoria linicola]